MTITLTDDLERQVTERAEQLGIPPDEVVRRAVAWYVQADPDLWAELKEWQAATWRAWGAVEESLR